MNFLLGAPYIRCYDERGYPFNHRLTRRERLALRLNLVTLRKLQLRYGK